MPMASSSAIHISRASLALFFRARRSVPIGGRRQRSRKQSLPIDVPGSMPASRRLPNLLANASIFGGEAAATRWDGSWKSRVKVIRIDCP